MGGHRDLPSDKPDILLLCHRIPYPPDKGDKIRSYRWLCALAAGYRVHLVAFVDEEQELDHQSYLDSLCATCRLFHLDRRFAAVRSLFGLVTGEPLTLPYYRDRRVSRWLDELTGTAGIGTVIVYSSAMAQYVPSGTWGARRRIVDFVDVDSDKWRQYGLKHRGPKRWLYRREAERLEAYEVAVAQSFDLSLFVSPAEAAFFQSRDPGGGACIEAVSNGVDTDYFRPDGGIASPFPPGGPVVVFTGHMRYWANVDAVRWFVKEIWPEVLSSHPHARFYIVGAQPSPEVARLASDNVVVTGRVADVRPYLQCASVVVAPLRIARGIQCKVLEGMAMAKTVVLTDKALEGIDAVSGQEVLSASDTRTFARYVTDTLSGRSGGVGAAARERVLAQYSWDRHCARFLDLVAGG
jgi:sugar transferase (PEP-CTERM/EpsH1 system associated)